MHSRRPGVRFRGWLYMYLSIYLCIYLCVCPGVSLCFEVGHTCVYTYICLSIYLSEPHSLAPTLNFHTLNPNPASWTLDHTLSILAVESGACPGLD